MSENFQEDHSRSGVDAYEAFERLLHCMQRLNATMFRLEVALGTASMEFSCTCKTA